MDKLNKYLVDHYTLLDFDADKIESIQVVKKITTNQV